MAATFFFFLNKVAPHELLVPISKAMLSLAEGAEHYFECRKPVIDVFLVSGMLYSTCRQLASVEFSLGKAASDFSSNFAAIASSPAAGQGSNIQSVRCRRLVVALRTASEKVAV